MTQNPGSSEPPQEPTAPTYSSYPAPPPQQGPGPGTPPYAGPPTNQTYGAPPRRTRRRRFGALGGVIAVVVVIGVKILIGFGIGGIFHHAQHRVGDAETVVRSALGADTAAGFTADFAAGLPARSVIDPSCEQDLTDGGTYKITKSAKEDDGSADVTVDLTGISSDMHFHLVDIGGWKIDHITCG